MSADRYPAHIPPALAGVLGQPPHALHPWWMALREVGVEVPTRYEGEVAAALHFLVPHALRSPDSWRGAAAEQLVRLREGEPFAPDEILVADASTVTAATLVLLTQAGLAQALTAAVLALRSYQFGNSVPDLAKATAEEGDRALLAAGLPAASLGSSL